MTDAPSPLDFRVVRLAARAELTPERRRELDRAVAEGPTWTHVLRLGQVHGVLPLLDAHLGDAMPPEPAAALHQHVKRSAIRVLFLASEMAALARTFQDAQISYLVMKGPSMAQAYGGTSRRPYVDNDLLIRREDFDRAEQVLTASGFRRRLRTGLKKALYLLVHGEYTFARVQGAMTSTVDVHTRLLPFGFAFDGPFEVLLERSRAMTVAGEEVPALGWDDLYLTLAVNALKDQWGRLRLASDFAEVAGMVADWSALLTRAKAGRCLRATRLAVLVSANELGAEYPPHVLEEARADWRAVRLARLVATRLREAHERPVMPSGQRFAFNALATDGPRGQGRYLWYATVRRATQWYADPSES